MDNFVIAKLSPMIKQAAGLLVGGASWGFQFSCWFIECLYFSYLPTSQFFNNKVYWSTIKNCINHILSYAMVKLHDFFAHQENGDQMLL